MNPAKPISMLAKESSVALLEKCLKDAKGESSKVFQSGSLVRIIHEDGCKNFAEPSSVEKSLSVGKILADGIFRKHQQHTKSKVQFFGQNISNAIDILTKN